MTREVKCLGERWPEEIPSAGQFFPAVTNEILFLHLYSASLSQPLAQLYVSLGNEGGQEKGSE